MVAADVHTPRKLKTFLASTDKTEALKKSGMDFLNASCLNARAERILWGEADKSPLYTQKRATRYDKDTGDELPPRIHPKSKVEMIYRSNRALSGHTLRTMASGAAANIGAQLANECKTLRTRSTSPENPKYPLLPQIQLAAQRRIEAAYISYMQEMFHTAVVIKNTVRKHKKVTAKCCQMAADIVNARIAAATSFVPESLALRKVVGVTIKKTRKKESKAAKAAKAAKKAAAKE